MKMGRLIYQYVAVLTAWTQDHYCCVHKVGLQVTSLPRRKF